MHVHPSARIHTCMFRAHFFYKHIFPAHIHVSSTLFLQTRISSTHTCFGHTYFYKHVFPAHIHVSGTYTHTYPLNEYTPAHIHPTRIETRMYTHLQISCVPRVCCDNTPRIHTHPTEEYTHAHTHPTHIQTRTHTHLQISVYHVSVVTVLHSPDDLPEHLPGLGLLKPAVFGYVFWKYTNNTMVNSGNLI